MRVRGWTLWINCTVPKWDHWTQGSPPLVSRDRIVKQASADWCCCCCCLFIAHSADDNDMALLSLTEPRLPFVFFPRELLYSSLLLSAPARSTISFSLVARPDPGCSPVGHRTMTWRRVSKPTSSCQIYIYDVIINRFPLITELLQLGLYTGNMAAISIKQRPLALTLWQKILPRPDCKFCFYVGLRSLFHAANCW